MSYREAFRRRDEGDRERTGAMLVRTLWAIDRRAAILSLAAAAAVTGGIFALMVLAIALTYAARSSHFIAFAAVAAIGFFAELLLGHVLLRRPWRLPLSVALLAWTRQPGGTVTVNMTVAAGQAEIAMELLRGMGFAHVRARPQPPPRHGRAGEAMVELDAIAALRMNEREADDLSLRAYLLVKESGIRVASIHGYGLAG